MSFNNPFQNFFNTKAEKPGIVEPKVDAEPKFPSGQYRVRATFINRKGETMTHDTGFRLSVSKPITYDELKVRANGDIAFMGPHNFGMDVYIERYPNGHPVTVEIVNEQGNPVYSYSQLFNGSGYAVK